MCFADSEQERENGGDDRSKTKRRRQRSGSPVVAAVVVDLEQSPPPPAAAKTDEFEYKPPVRPEPKTETQTTVENLLTTRTGGAYIPPAKLRAMQEQIGDKTR